MSDHQAGDRIRNRFKHETAEFFIFSIVVKRNLQLNYNASNFP